MSYTRSRPSWASWPSTSTPIRRTDLENWDATLATHDTKISTLQSLEINVKDDYGAVGDGSTDDTAAWNAALAAVPNGGTIIFPNGFTYRGAFVLDTNKRIRVLGYGATLKPLNSGIAFKVAQGNGSTIAGCNVEGFVIDGNGVTAPTGIQLLNTDRTVLRDLRIINCTTGLELKADAGGWVEEWAFQNSLISNCTTGISFNKTATGQGSFGESMILNVGVNGCTTGLTANSGSSLYRTLFSNLVFWLNNNTTGMTIDCNVIDANWFCSFETLGSGTGTVGVNVTANSVNTQLMNAQFSFTGSIATKVQATAGHPVIWKQSTVDTWIVDDGRGSRVLRLGDTAARFEVTTQNAGGGGILLGDGTTLDGNLYRGGTSLIGTDNDLALFVAGKTLKIKEGANAKMGTAVLVAGTVVVSTTAITASSRVFLTSQNTGAAPGALRLSARTAGTSFTVTSSNAGDTSTIAWLLLEPA